MLKEFITSWLLQEKLAVLKNFAIMKEQSSAGVFQSKRSQIFCKVHRKTSKSFNEVVGRRPQAYYFIKRETSAEVEICKVLKNIFFIEQLWLTASGYIRILTTKKLQYQLIISKSYKEEGRRERSKLLLPTHINLPRFTLIKGLFKPYY